MGYNRNADVLGHIISYCNDISDYVKLGTADWKTSLPYFPSHN